MSSSQNYLLCPIYQMLMTTQSSMFQLYKYEVGDDFQILLVSQ